jgi:hypothetical protein
LDDITVLLALILLVLLLVVAALLYVAIRVLPLVGKVGGLVDKAAGLPFLKDGKMPKIGDAVGAIAVTIGTQPNVIEAASEALTRLLSGLFQGRSGPPATSQPLIPTTAEWVGTPGGMPNPPLPPPPTPPQGGT